MKSLSNVMAVAGAVLICVGVGMFSLAAGLVAMGIFLIVGAIATVKLDDEKVRAVEFAKETASIEALKRKMHQS